MPVLLHVLRLGLGDASEGLRVRSRTALSGGRLVRRSPDRICLLLRRELRNLAARRRDRELRGRGQASLRLSSRPVRPKHEERDRAGVHSPEDSVRRRAQQGRRGGVAVDRSNDAPKHQAEQHLDGVLPGAPAAVHPRRRRDVHRPDSGLAGRDVQRVRGRRRYDHRERPAQPDPVQQPLHPAQCRDGRSRLSEEVRGCHDYDREGSASGRGTEK